MAIFLLTRGQQTPDDPTTLTYTLDYDDVAQTIGLTVTGLGRATATLFDNNKALRTVELADFSGLGRQVMESHVRTQPNIGVDSPFWISVQWGV